LRALARRPSTLRLRFPEATFTLGERPQAIEARVSRLRGLRLLARPLLVALARPGLLRRTPGRGLA
jgi:hypothetical protein